MILEVVCRYRNKYFRKLYIKLVCLRKNLHINKGSSLSVPIDMKASWKYKQLEIHNKDEQIEIIDH